MATKPAAVHPVLVFLDLFRPAKDFFARFRLSCAVVGWVAVAVAVGQLVRFPVSAGSVIYLDCRSYNAPFKLDKLSRLPRVIPVT
jgi:hypothetical protein